MRKAFLFLLAFIVILSVSAAVFAEQNPCTVDSYGCWISTDGGKSYIRYWSEAARPYIENADTASHADLLLLTRGSSSAEQNCRTVIIGGEVIESCVIP